jgi:hypothetical protein
MSNDRQQAAVLLELLTAVVSADADATCTGTVLTQTRSYTTILTDIIYFTAATASQWIYNEAGKDPTTILTNLMADTAVARMRDGVSTR